MLLLYVYNKSRHKRNKVNKVRKCLDMTNYLAYKLKNIGDTIKVIKGMADAEIEAIHVDALCDVLMEMINEVSEYKNEMKSIMPEKEYEGMVKILNKFLVSDKKV